MPLVWWCDKRHVNKICLGRPPTEMWLVGDLHHSSTFGAQVKTFVWCYSPPLHSSVSWKNHVTQVEVYRLSQVALNNKLLVQVMA